MAGIWSSCSAPRQVWISVWPKEALSHLRPARAIARGCSAGMDVLRWDRAVLLAGPARLTEGSESPASGMGLGLTGRSRARASHCPLARGVTGAEWREEWIGCCRRKERQRRRPSRRANESDAGLIWTGLLHLSFGFRDVGIVRLEDGLATRHRWGECRLSASVVSYGLSASSPSAASSISLPNSRVWADGASARARSPRKGAGLWCDCSSLDFLPTASPCAGPLCAPAMHLFAAHPRLMRERTQGGAKETDMTDQFAPLHPLEQLPLSRFQTTLASTWPALLPTIMAACMAHGLMRPRLTRSGQGSAPCWRRAPNLMPRNGPFTTMRALRRREPV